MFIRHALIIVFDAGFVNYEALALYEETYAPALNKLKQYLHLPDYYRIYVVVLVGFPAEIPFPPARVSKYPKFPINFDSGGQKPFREKVSGLPKVFFYKSTLFTGKHCHKF